MGEETERMGEMRRKIRVAVRQEDLEDLKAHGERWSLAQTEEDVEGQGYKIGFGQTEEDVEGQGYRGGFLEPIGPDEDVEAQGYVWTELEPDEDDTSGQSWRYGG